MTARAIFTSKVNSHRLNPEFYQRKLTETFDPRYASIMIWKSNKKQRNGHSTQKFFEKIHGLDLNPRLLGKRKNRKKWYVRGIEPETFGFEDQSHTTELRRLITCEGVKKLTKQHTYDIVLANFSQFPPFSAIFHIYSMKVYHFCQLFCICDMSEPE